MITMKRSAAAPLVKLRRLDGNVESVRLRDRFLNLRYGREPGQYLILHVPRSCYIHHEGEALPLKDVQFCDYVTVHFRRHPKFQFHIAQEIELN
jgi:NAD(P)H-flavin reductase